MDVRLGNKQRAVNCIGGQNPVTHMGQYTWAKFKCSGHPKPFYGADLQHTVTAKPHKLGSFSRVVLLPHTTYSPTKQAGK